MALPPPAASSSSSNYNYNYNEEIVSAPIKATNFKDLVDELRSDPFSLTSLDLSPDNLSFYLRKEEHRKLCDVLLSLPPSSSLTQRIKKLHVEGIFSSAEKFHVEGIFPSAKFHVDFEVAACYARLLPAFPSLEHLSFYRTSMGRKGFGLILDSLRSHSHPYLTHLSFSYDNTWSMLEEDEEEAFLQPLLEMLRNPNDPPHLRVLTLSRIRMGAKGVGLLATTLTQINSSLRSLDLSRNHKIADEGVECISKMLHSNTSLLNLNLVSTGFSRVGAEFLARALTINTSLTTLDISSNDQIGEEGIDCFHVITSLKHLKCRYFFRIYQGFMNILQYNTFLTTLDLRGNEEEDPCHVEELFKAIAHNQGLHSLDLSNCKAVKGKKVLSCILDSLQFNSTLTQIDLMGTPLHKERQTAAIYEALQERMENMNLGVSEMRKAIPNIARLFFCGFPCAGKTTLRRAMIHATKKGNTVLKYLKPSFSYHNSATINERTRGIDIRYIHRSDLTFSLWDMAGQQDYHSFHDFMFPNISDVGSPSLFLIICNPMNDNGTAKTKECVGKEIKYWLRFISSKARLTERFKPSVTIVLTRKDKKHNFSTSPEMINHVDKLRASFNARVNLSHDVLEVDARSIRSSIKVLDYMRKKASNVLHRLPYTYACADEVRHLLNAWKENHPLTPILSLGDFIDICNNIRELEEANASQSTSGSLSNNQKLVALTLNRSGDILYFQDLEYIVVDMQWFSHELMGQMIYSEAASNGHSIVQQEGFIEWNDFEAVLNRSLISRNKNQSQFKNKTNTGNEAAIKPKQVLHMMQKLNLCYTHDTISTPAPRLFIPANLKPAIGLVPWQLQTCIPLIKVGRRLQCLHQEQTFLTPNFFPQIQISLYNSFRTDDDSKCYLLRDFISIIDLSNGIEFHLEFHSPDSDGVLDSNSLPGNVEYDEDQHYIDMLIKSTKGSTETLELLHLMMDKIKDFCASSRGCQGVSLVEGVIKTDCLENPEMYPRRQCVLVSTLQEKLLKLPISKMRNDVYCWKQLRPSMNVMAEKTEHLLGSKAFVDVVRRRVNDVQVVANHLEIEAPIKDRGIFPYVETLMERWPHNAPNNSPGTLSFDIIMEFMRRLVRIEEKVDVVNLKVEELIEKLDNWISLEEKVVNDLQSQINLLLNMNIMSHERRIPHLFHFTRKTPEGICEKIVDFVSSSVLDCYQLHFYCEGVAPVRGGGEHSPHSMVHEFKDGLKLFISKSKKLKNALPYLNKVLTLINLVAKVGAHVVGGAGSMVPDFSKIPALIFDTGVFHIDAMKLDELDPELLQSDATTLQQNKSAKQWLFDILIENDCFNGKAISETFGLYRMRNKENSQVSWVCNLHKEHSELEDFPVF